MIKKNNKLNTVFVKKLMNNNLFLLSESFILKYWPVSTDKKMRFGIVLSKKIIKSAVARNFLKRKFYGIVRNFLINDYKKFNLKSNFYILLILKSNVNKMSKKEAISFDIENEVKKLLIDLFSLNKS